MKVTFTVRRPFPGPIVRVVIIVVIYMLVAHRLPGDVLPLGIGGVLGCWLGVAIAPFGIG